MKRILQGCGIVALVLVALFVVLLIWAFKAGGAHQEAFFRAVQSGDPKQVAELFHPALAAEIDEPMLAAWMKAMKEKLGDFKGLAKSDFSTSTNIKDGVRMTESKGTVNFEKGSAKSELVLRDGKIVKFNVVSDNLKDWFAGPATTDLYREKGKEFLTDLLSDKVDDAFAMMHENLQKEMPLDKLKAAMPAVKERFGALKSVSFESEQFKPGDVPELDIPYKVICEKQETKGRVGFQFLGMKAHLLSFDLPAKP